MNSYTLLAASLLLSIAAFSQQPQLIVPVGHTSYLNYFALSPDGRHILTASSDQTTRLWDRDGHLIATLKESESNEVLVHNDLLMPANTQTIHFNAPAQPGEYPYLCTFPGHWMVMNGVLVVE